MAHNQLLVIDPAMKTAEVSAFNRIAIASPIKATYHLPAMYGFSSLASVSKEDIRGIIIFGSATSVHDRLAWQKELESWLKPLLLSSIPTLGICYAHQMLAYMFGGEVNYMYPDQTKLLGLRQVEFLKTPWFAPQHGEVIVSHNETVTKIPENFHIIAKSDLCPTDGMAHDSLPIWSYQSHPEASIDFIQNGTMNIQDPVKALKFGHGLVQNFLEYLSTS